ncbi:hypothetical protein HDU81_009983 [Chytriomyces hyalinus]|nr:hypothetical protein HDU81_009983 [Chytriomyces hyalinus]
MPCDDKDALLAFDHSSRTDSGFLTSIMHETDSSSNSDGTSVTQAPQEDSDTGNEPPPSIQSLHNTSICLLLRYDQPDGIYFDETMPAELEGQLSAFEFQTRIKEVNARLAAMGSLDDCAPHARTGLAALIVALTVVLLALGGRQQSNSGIILWLSGIVFISVVICATFSFKHKCERRIHPLLDAYNTLDETIQLKWTLDPPHAQTTRNFFAFNLTPESWRVPWQIQIQYLHKGEAVFLPAYAPRESMWAYRRGSVGSIMSSFSFFPATNNNNNSNINNNNRPPSYKSMSA